MRGDAISSHEMALGFSERQMARAPVAPDPGPRADGDVLRRADLRSPFTVEHRRQRDGAIVVLCDRFWIGRGASGGTDRLARLEWNQERKTGVENRAVSHGAQSSRGDIICD